MFTVLQKIDGNENLFAAESVDYYRAPAKNVLVAEHQFAHIEIHFPKGHEYSCSQFYIGSFYVMNEAGKTVATYHLAGQQLEMNPY